jgi:hypothetical protein
MPTNAVISTIFHLETNTGNPSSGDDMSAWIDSPVRGQPWIFTSTFHRPPLMPWPDLTHDSRKSAMAAMKSVTTKDQEMRHS